MRTHLKRLLRIGLVGIVVMVFAVQAHVVLPTSAQAAERLFDASNLNGAYAGGIIGASLLDLDPPDPAAHSPVAAVVRVVADGVENLTLETRRNSGGMFSTNTRQCTYVIESNGFGTVTCLIGTTVRIIHLVLSDGGRQFDVVLEGEVVAGGHFIQP
jgi:hypothetical protein